MVRSTWLPLLAVVSTAFVAGGCAAGLSHPATVLPAQAAVEAGSPAPIVSAPVDPVDQVIADSEAHFAKGQAALKLGHLDEARTEFNAAVDVLMQAPYGVDGDLRLRRQFDRTVDRISTEEVTALAQGDGFVEKKYEPASIDQLLALSTFDKPAPSAAVEQAVSKDLDRGGHDLQIPLTDQVVSYVEVFSGKLHDWFQEALNRGSQYLPMIQNVFRAEGLPLDLAYVPIVESAFKPDALSHASAKGVWQFMRETGMENGLKHDWYVDERSDPRKATVAAAKYLQTLDQIFDGNWLLALASYNGGPGRVQRAMKRAGGVDDFWRLQKRRGLLPRETREYVPMILAAIIVARSPAEYGFTLPAAQPVIADTVTLAEPVDLRRVAEWTGSSIEEIQALNPELRRWTTPVQATDYQLRVPQGTGDLVRAKVREAMASDIELASLRWYTVRRGDTLLRIARRLHVSRADLAQANYLSIRARLTAGKKLIVPREPAVLLASRVTSADDEEEASPSTASAGSRTRSRMVYRVKPGDTLTRIAHTFHTSVDELKRWNKLRSSRLGVGDRLTVYAIPSEAANGGGGQ